MHADYTTYKRLIFEPLFLAVQVSDCCTGRRRVLWAILTFSSCYFEQVGVLKTPNLRKFSYTSIIEFAKVIPIMLR